MIDIVLLILLFMACDWNILKFISWVLGCVLVLLVASLLIDKLFGDHDTGHIPPKEDK